MRALERISAAYWAHFCAVVVVIPAISSSLSHSGGCHVLPFVLFGNLLPIVAGLGALESFIHRDWRLFTISILILAPFCHLHWNPQNRALDYLINVFMCAYVFLTIWWLVRSFMNRQEAASRTGQ